MLELTLRVRADGAEEVLDRVLPALPGGLHQRERGKEVEMMIAATPGTPTEEELRRLAGEDLIDLATAEASDDWRRRRLDRHEPLVIADRLHIRPEWAPPGDPGLTEILLAEGAAFGTGLHPTTQACLAVIAGLDGEGSFADIGCGSGVLSIAAAKLGFSPVVAIDVNEQSVSSAARNAALNGVEVDARRLDVTAEPPPAASTVAANVPPDVHLELVPRVEEPPALLIASGFQADREDEVASAWGVHGLEVTEKLRAHEWCLVVMR